MTKNDNQKLIKYASAVANLAHLVPGIGPHIAPIFEGILNHYQLKNLEYFLNELKTELERLKELFESKLDKPALNDPEFLRLASYVFREASWTVAEEKRKALSNALLGLCTIPRSREEARALYIRLLVDLTNEQIILLSRIPGREGEHVSSEDLAKNLGMSGKAVAVFCHDLARMGLISDNTWGGIGRRGPGSWMLTLLGAEMINYCSYLQDYYQTGES